MVVFITEQGAKIHCEARHLIVRTHALEQILFPDHLRQILIFGNIALTPQARSLILASHIDTVFFRKDGRFLGRLSSAYGHNAHLRKKQFLRHEDAEFCLRLARSIVKGKIINQKNFLYRIGRESGAKDATLAAEELHTYAPLIDSCEDIDKLRGLEGRGAAIYFSAFACGLHQDWGFKKRIRRPPTDPVNVILSLLYSILAQHCHSACHRCGLDPAPGCLHVMEYSRHALPLDLMEEFRTIIVDALTLSLFNRHILKLEDFIADDQELDDSGLILSQEAMKKVIGEFTKKMDSEFYHHAAQRKISHSEALHFQANHYRRVIEGEISDYQPLIYR